MSKTGSSKNDKNTNGNSANTITLLQNKHTKMLLDDKPIVAAKLDEIHTYVNQKNYRWGWIAVDRLSKRYMAFVFGDRSTAAGLKLWDKIKDVSMENIASDCWNSYAEFVPVEKHLQTKAEVYGGGIQCSD